MTNTKYKVGDIIQIRMDLQTGERYDDILFARKMDYLRGKNVKVVGMYKAFSGNCCAISASKDSYNDEWIITDTMIVGKSNSQNVITE